MARSRSSSPRADGRKRGRIACTTCRQAKVRCNLETIPCARCAKLSLDCSVDPSFKRTNRHDKVHELESHVQQLQDIVQRQQDGQQRSPSEPGTNSTQAARGVTSGVFRESQRFSTSSLTPDQRIASPSPEERVLGHVRLHISQVEALFRIFFEKFHPSLPILDPSRTADEYFASSTVLFWTIIAIAARQYRVDSDLLGRLWPLLSDHLWTEFGNSHKSVTGANAWNITEIQAMLLLATWPLPNVRLWSDKSLVLSNMALTSSMHIGLHRPGYEYDYCREKINITQKMVVERTEAWLAAYATSISLCIEHGHLPLVPTVDWTVNNICGDAPLLQISNDLRHNVLIQKCGNNAFQRLAQLCDDPAAVGYQPSFYPTMSLLENNFDNLEKQLVVDISLMNKLRLQGTRLLLQCAFFLGDAADSERRRGILRAYSSATGLIRMLISDDRTNDLLSYAPHATLRMILRAAFVIVRVLLSSYGADLDRDNGRILYNTAAFFIRQMSITPANRDNPARVAEALRETWPVLEQDQSRLNLPPTIAIKSRGGASLIYDSLVLYRDHVKLVKQGLKNGTSTSSVPQPSIATGQEQTLASYNDVVSGPQWVEGRNDVLLDDPLMDFSDLSWMDDFGYPGMFVQF